MDARAKRVTEDCTVLRVVTLDSIAAVSSSSKPIPTDGLFRAHEEGDGEIHARDHKCAELETACSHGAKLSGICGAYRRQRLLLDRKVP